MPAKCPGRVFIALLGFLVIQTAGVSLFAQVSPTLVLSRDQEYITSQRDLITYYSIDPSIADAQANKDGFLVIKARNLGRTIIYYNDGLKEQTIEVDVIEKEIPAYRAAGRVERQYSPDYHTLSAGVNALYDENSFFYNRFYFYSADLNFPLPHSAWLRSQVYAQQNPQNGFYVNTARISYERPNFETVLGDNDVTFGLYNTSIMSGIAFRGLTLGFFPKNKYDFSEKSDSKLYVFGGIRMPTANQPFLGPKDDEEFGGGLSWQDVLTDEFKYSIAVGSFNEKNKPGHPLMLTTSQEFTPTKELRFTNTFLYNNGSCGVLFDPAFKFEYFQIYPYYHFLQNELGAPFSDDMQYNTKHQDGIQFREFLRNKTITLYQGFKQVFNRPNPARNYGSGMDNSATAGANIKFQRDMELDASYQFYKSKLGNYTTGGYLVDDTSHYGNLYYRATINEFWSGYSSLNIGKNFSGVQANSFNVDSSTYAIFRKDKYLFTANMDFHTRAFNGTTNIYSPGASFGYNENWLNLRYYLYWNLVQQFPDNQYVINSVLNTVFRPSIAHEFTFNVGTSSDMKIPKETLNGYVYLNYAYKFGHGIRAKPFFKEIVRSAFPQKVMGYVFIDGNHNLQFDPGEKGVGNVALKSISGEAKTDSRGFYSVKFDKETPSTEVYVEPDALPEGYEFAEENRKYFIFADQKVNYFSVALWKRTSQVDIITFEDVNGDGIYTFGVDRQVPNVPVIIKMNGDMKRVKSDLSGAIYLVDVDARNVKASVNLDLLPDGVEAVAGADEGEVALDKPSYYVIHLQLKSSAPTP